MKNQRRILLNILKDKRLSEFEKKVYRAVSTIPAGEVRSYGWVARKALHPGAYRAVGNALNKNPYAPAIPCHRVVKSDGSVGGYSKGVILKKKMLKREGVDYVKGCCYNLKNDKGAIC